jgi:Zn-dependent protease
VFGNLFSPEKVILIGIFLLVGFPVHEFSHALVAYRLGDATAKLFGRLTLNPVAHFDRIGGLLLVISVIGGGFVFGWAKPTPVNPSNLRDRRNGEVAVALAGPASNLVMASIVALVIRGTVAAGIPLQLWFANLLFDFVWFNVALAIFNLIPIPPLDGSSLLYRFLPLRYAWQLRPLISQYGLVVLILFIFTLGPYLAEAIQNVASFLAGPIFVVGL